GVRLAQRRDQLARDPVGDRLGGSAIGGGHRPLEVLAELGVGGERGGGLLREPDVCQGTPASRRGPPPQPAPRPPPPPPPAGAPFSVSSVGTTGTRSGSGK